MTREDLLDHVRRQPFVPFRLTLTTGRTFDVYHPDQIMVLRREAIIGTINQPPDGVIDRATHADLFHIVTVDPLPPVTPAGSNGQSTTPPNAES